MRRRLVIPKRALDAFLQLIRLSKEQLLELCNILNSQYGATEEFEDLLLLVGEKLDVSTEESIDLINVVNNLTAQRQTFAINNEDFIAELNSLVEDRHDIAKEIQIKKDIILDLTGPRQEAEYYEKIRFLQTGLIDTAKNFKSICDIRPIFNEERTEIKDLIPIIIFQVEFEKKDDRPSHSVVFQLNEKAYEELKDSIKWIDKKLGVIKNFISSKKEEA